VVACGRDGHFELNVTIPLIAKALLESITVLANASRTFSERCVEGLQVNLEQCAEHVQRSLMLVTALNPHIGYDRAAAVAKKAYSENKTLREVVLEMGLMEERDLDAALDPMEMIRPKE
jgi:fumarate hydratase class II